MKMQHQVFRNPYCLAIYVVLLQQPMARKEFICNWYSINATVCSHSLVDLHFAGYVQIIRQRDSSQNQYVAFNTPQFFYPKKKREV